MKFVLDTEAPTIDLSMAIEEHWRFAPTIEYSDQETAGCAFHSTRISMGAHGFTHVDAPWHIDPRGSALEQQDLSRLWGQAVVVDVSDVGPDRPITADDLRRNVTQIEPGDIVLLRSGHEARFPTTTPEYWTKSPWVSADAARWVAQHRPAAVGYDFPQDRGIRSSYLDTWQSGDLDEDWACHRLLLHQDIPQIEYLTNLVAIKAEHCLFFAVPLHFARSDGSPVRAFAIDASSGHA